jgi:cytochrome c5
MFRASATTAIVLATTFFFACGKKSEPQQEQEPVVVPASPVAVAANSGKDAQKYFKTKCVVCHGADGAGDGPGAAALEPKPRAFADATWQEGITDEDLGKVITEGGASVGKSPGMPAHPDLKGKQDLLKDLIGMIRDFQGE